MININFVFVTICYLIFLSYLLISCDAFLLKGKFNYCKPSTELVDLEKCCPEQSIECSLVINSLRVLKKIENEYHVIKDFNKTKIFYSNNDELYFAYCESLDFVEIPEKVDNCSLNVFVYFYINKIKQSGFINRNSIVVDDSFRIICTNKTDYFHIENKYTIIRYDNLLSLGETISRPLPLIMDLKEVTKALPTLTRAIVGQIARKELNENLSTFDLVILIILAIVSIIATIVFICIGLTFKKLNVNQENDSLSSNRESDIKTNQTAIQLQTEQEESSKVQCNFCGNHYTRIGINKHLKACKSKSSENTNNSKQLQLQQ